MSKLVVALIIGFIIGKLSKLSYLQKFTDWLIQLGVIILLFSMGIQMGINKEILNKISFLGWQAFVLALFAVIFSVLIVHFIVRKFVVISAEKGELDHDVGSGN